jgi:SagB-type dehydrogenase family enzyme
MKDQNKILKSNRWDEWNNYKTDQDKNIPAPPIQKPFLAKANLIDLISPEHFSCGTMPIIEAIRNRRSRRQFTGESIEQEGLSFLLWATQGINKVEKLNKVTRAYRSVPSGGCRHPFETYILINTVEGYDTGLYRYIPLKHKLILINPDHSLRRKIHEACYKQFVMKSAVVFIWTVIPYRTEWRYSFLSPKIIAQDSGHLCQNLYLSCEALGLGTCAIGSYDQKHMDQLIGVDGEKEFTIYLAPVGRVNN